MHTPDFCGRPTAVLNEAQRLAYGIPHKAIRLKGPFSALLRRVNALGSVTTLTHNASAIQEKSGIYDFASAQDSVGSINALHQRVFYRQWKYGFAVVSGDQRSLQFFDADGCSVHQVVLHENSNVAAFQHLVADFRAVEQAPLFDAFNQADDKHSMLHIDVDALRADWACINTAQDFFTHQDQFDRDRLQKLRLAGKAFAHQVANDSARILLQKMADLGSAIMTQVGNHGIMQAYQGGIKQIFSLDSWLNILNPGYRLRLREDHIDTVWVTKKPTTDGIITSLELFNRQSVSIARFFSKPEPGYPEARTWRDSIMRLPPVFGA